jgi:hypothetical protein
MNHRDLESWAERAAQELQELADELEESGSDPGAVRVLIDEYEVIFGTGARDGGKDDA